LRNNILTHPPKKRNRVHTRFHNFAPKILDFASFVKNFLELLRISEQDFEKTFLLSFLPKPLASRAGIGYYTYK